MVFVKSSREHWIVKVDLTKGSPALQRYWRQSAAVKWQLQRRKEPHKEKRIFVVVHMPRSYYYTNQIEGQNVIFCATSPIW